MSTMNYVPPAIGNEPSEMARQILCNFQLQCTEDEVAVTAGMTREEFDHYCVTVFGAPAAVVRNAELARGRQMLRKQLWEMSEKNPTLSIFLAKNYLGMTNDGHRPGESVMIVNDLLGIEPDGDDFDPCA